MYLYFRAVNAPDYFERRDRPFPDNLSASRHGSTYRLAHINLYLECRAARLVRSGGPSPDGATADVIFNFDTVGEVEEFLKDDPYVIGGVWASWSLQPLTDCVEPLTPAPVCLDGTRRITLVEESVVDQGSTASALRRLRDQGALALGGITAEGAVIAWMNTPDHEDALRLWKGAGMNASANASCRSLVWVL